MSDTPPTSPQPQPDSTTRGDRKHDYKLQSLVGAFAAGGAILVAFIAGQYSYSIANGQNNAAANQATINFAREQSINAYYDFIEQNERLSDCQSKIDFDYLHADFGDRNFTAEIRQQFADSVATCNVMLEDLGRKKIFIDMLGGEDVRDQSKKVLDAQTQISWDASAMLDYAQGFSGPLRPTKIEPVVSITDLTAINTRFVDSIRTELDVRPKSDN